MDPRSFLLFLIEAYTIVVLVTVIVSWLSLPPSNPVVRYTRMLTEPALVPLRKLVPPAGGIDFSPMLLLILLLLISAML